MRSRDRKFIADTKVGQVHIPLGGVDFRGAVRELSGM